MVELFATAAQLVGPVLQELEEALMADMARVLQSTGIAANEEVGLTAKDLAQHLYAASHGIKHYCKSAADYRDRIRVAVRLVCRTRK